jgi:hypothetical protein
MDSINVVGCIKGEIHSIMTLMRLNTRWAARGRFSSKVRERACMMLFLRSPHTYANDHPPIFYTLYVQIRSAQRKMTL